MYRGHWTHKPRRRSDQKAVRMKRALCAERTIPSCQRKIDNPAAAQTGQGASVPPLPVALPSDLHMQSFGGASQPRHQAIGGRLKRELNIEPVCLRRGIGRELRSEARRGGTESVRRCECWGWVYIKKKKKTT